MEENGERGDGMDEERRMNAPEAQERSSFRKFKFFGSYDHSIDAKGRIIVPNAYRKALGESFTITVSLDDRAVAIYPDEAFETMVDELYALNRRKPAVQKQLDHVAKFSYPGMQADNQGRVLLPVKLRQYVLGDARDVEISGAMDHIRIVASAVAQEEDSYYKEHRDEILDEIGNLPPHLQSKLLTAIQGGRIFRVGSNTPVAVDIRLICATNRDLFGMVARGGGVSRRPALPHQHDPHRPAAPAAAPRRHPAAGGNVPETLRHEVQQTDRGFRPGGGARNGRIPLGG